MSPARMYMCTSKSLIILHYMRRSCSSEQLLVFSSTSQACDYGFTSRRHRIANLFTRVPLVAADLIVVAITWSATYKAMREARVLGRQPSIIKILFKDGPSKYLSSHFRCSDSGNRKRILHVRLDWLRREICSLTRNHSILTLLNILHLVFTLVSVSPS